MRRPRRHLLVDPEADRDGWQQGPNGDEIFVVSCLGDAITLLELDAFDAVLIDDADLGVPLGRLLRVAHRTGTAVRRASSGLEQEAREPRQPRAGGVRT